jgi:hypothetical protein
MIDDFRRPRSNKINTQTEDQNKYRITQANQMPSTEAPHLYEQEEGFVTANASMNLHHSHFSNPFEHVTKKQKIIAGIITAVLVLGGGGAYALLNKSSPKPVTPAPAAAAVAPVPPKPTTEASRLTGVQITPELNKRPVTSIQIENSPDARPQSGLQAAGVVYEAIAEGGITRFNASFMEAQPDYIGPVRSVRPYYAILASPFDPIFVHAGGSGDGLAKLRELGLKDLDHGANGAAFQRISERYAPHNLYTSTAALDKASQGRGYTTSNVKGFERKNEQPGQAVTARAINLTMSSALYNVHYDYDPAGNSYKRSEGGKPHTDQRSGAQLAPKTVVALVMNYAQNGIYSVYQTLGSGKAYVFQDGVVYQGTWTKTAEKEQLTFKDDAGKTIQLNAGQTWFTLVKNTGSVAFTP